MEGDPIASKECSTSQLKTLGMRSSRLNGADALFRVGAAGRLCILLMDFSLDLFFSDLRSFISMRSSHLDGSELLENAARPYSHTDTDLPGQHRTQQIIHK
jgi:hypothetical protein